MEKTVICSRFSLQKKLGAGSFGEIYSAEDIVNHKTVAVKLESNKARSPQLEFEARLYQIMSEGAGVPKIYFYDSDGKHNVMAMELLGKSLEDLLTANKRPLSLKTVLMLADQMIESVQYIHSKHFIHRDIKPDNFVMGLKGTNNENKVFIIDFGLAKRYRDPKTFAHIPYVENKSLTGTARYASLNATRGCEQSRRDDMESLGIVLIYLLKGKLPWQGLPARDQRQKMKKILEVKKNTTIEELCEGLPNEFCEYMHLIRNLGFEEEPDYAKYRDIFRQLLIKESFIYDSIFDWTNIKSKMNKSKNNLKQSKIQNNAPQFNDAIPNPPTQLPFMVHPPEESPPTGRCTVRHFAARRYAIAGQPSNSIRRSMEKEIVQIQNQPSNTISTARTSNDKRLKTAIPVPRLPTLNPRINRPQISPRHYSTRRPIQVGE